MSKFSWLLSAVLFLSYLLIPSNSNAQQSVSVFSGQWTGFSIDDVVYAEVVEAPDAVYRNPEFSDDPAEWIRENNTFLFGQAINVSERHRFLDRDHMVRVRLINGEWGEILPDGLHSPYIPDPTGYHPTYVHLSYLYPVGSEEFMPITVFDDTQPMDKLIVVIADQNPRFLLYEGNHLVMKIPVVLGPTPYGDYRVYRTRVTDDMPGIPAVPFSNYFSGGYTIHGAPWWNWRETTDGHYGSHGCVNLPDDEWYQVRMDDNSYSIDQWVYRWISSNINYDESDPEENQARVNSDDAGWYQPFDTVRTIVVNEIDELTEFPLTRVLGDNVREAQVQNWQTLIDAYNEVDNQWLLTHYANGEAYQQTYDATRSIAQIEGNSESDTWILLECSASDRFDVPAYPGSSRTAGELCEHLQVDRQGSICTPERIDLDFFGKRVLCNAEKFNALHIRERGELIEHERIHMIQFSNYFKELAIEGVLADDTTPREVTVDQNSIIGISELMAQSQNTDSRYAEDYMFALARPNEDGEPVVVDYWATTEQTWLHLHKECGDPSGQDPNITRLLEQGLMGEQAAYEQLVEICSMPPHRLVPDRSRRVD